MSATLMVLALLYAGLALGHAIAHGDFNWTDMHYVAVMLGLVAIWWKE